MKLSSEHKKEFIFLGVCLLLTGGLFAAEQLLEVEPWTVAVGYGLLYLLIGGEIFLSALKELFSGKPFNEETLMSIAAIGAFCIGSYVEGAAVLIFYRVGEAFTDMAADNARDSVAALMEICPDAASLVTDGDEKIVHPSEVKVGDVVAVRPGEKLPLDGVVVSGGASIDTSSVTGESVPRRAEAGDQVYAGCLCLDGALRVRVTAPYEDSTVANMIKLTEHAAERKAKTEKFITKFAAIYTPCVVGAAVVYAVAMPLIIGGGWIPCLKNALNFLVICCPCALVLSVPLAFFSACGRATKSGVLIKGGATMERLAKVGAVVFDKTGTVTDGKLEVASARPEGVSEAELIELASLAEHSSKHPVAEAIKRKYGKEPDASRVEGFSEEGGRGVSARIDGAEAFVGSRRFLEEHGFAGLPGADGATAVYVAAGGEFRGLITLRDELKPDAADAVELLRKAGVGRVAVFSGDSPEAAKAAAERIGADEGFGGLLPADKCDLLEKEKQAAVTAFAGDGINDAPAIASADVGVAMGALGSDAAIEAADVVLMGDSPSRIADAITISKKAVVVAKENIWFSLIVKAAVLVASALGYAPLWLAVVADVGAAIAAVANSALNGR